MKSGSWSKVVEGVVQGVVAGCVVAMTAASSCMATEAPAAPQGYTLGSSGFNDMLGKQIKPGTYGTEQQPDGSFILTNKIQTVSAHITPQGTHFDSIGSSEGKGGFGLHLAQWGREGSLQTSSPSQLYRDGDVVFHTHVDGIAEKFSNTSGGIQQDFIVAAKPTGKGNLHVQLAVSDATVTAKNDGAIIHLPSGRQLTYDRLAVTDSANKTIPAHIVVAQNNVVDVVVDDAAAQYPLTIDPTVGDANWMSIGDNAGQTHVVLVHGSNVYVGGYFTYVGSTRVNSIAVWNGTTWSALGTGITLSTDTGNNNPSKPSGVFALAMDSSGNLYAGGVFDTAGGITANNIAKWNGTSWSALGAGITYSSSGGGVDALGLDSSNNLYAGGIFDTAGSLAANSIAKWNGTAWSTLGAGVKSSAGGVVGNVITLAINSSGNLYVGGKFDKAGSVSVSDIAKWNGTSWSALSSGLNDEVDSLAIDSGGNVYAGGYFTHAGGVAANSIAKWNGTSWSALGSGITLSPAAGGGSVGVFALAIDSSGNLYAGGIFDTAGSVTANSVAKWNGSSWIDTGLVATGSDMPVTGLALDGSGNLYAAGQFITYTNNIVTGNFAKWNGSSWQGAGIFRDNSLYFTNVTAMVVDNSGNVYASGSNMSAMLNPFNYVAKWNGSEWSSIGSGLSDEVDALALDPSGNLYAGGWFLSTADGSVTLNNVAKWNGSVWSALGTGVGDGSGNTSVNALAFDKNGNLYAGGTFSVKANGTGSLLRNIAKWDGSSWGALGSGLGFNVTSTDDPAVTSLAVDQNGIVYAGGTFGATGNGNTALNYIGKWNGRAWSALGTGLSDVVHALAIDPMTNSVYAGGNFQSTNDGSVQLNFIGKWDGSSWNALGSGFNGGVEVLALGGDSLFAGGDFTATGDNSILLNHLARGVNQSWVDLDGGVFGTQNQASPDLPVTALAADFANGKLYVGGDFTNAGIAVNTFGGSAIWSFNWIATLDYVPAYAAPNSSFVVYGLSPVGVVTISASGGCTSVDNGTDSAIITMAGSGGLACNVNYSQAGDATHPAADPITLTTQSSSSLLPQSITITTPAPSSAALNSSFIVSATASSSLPVWINASGQGCVGWGRGSAVITMISNSTTCTIIYFQEGNGTYAAAPEIASTTTETIPPQSQTITVTTAAPSSAAYNTTFPVAATASSGLAVAITTSGGCSIAGGTVTMTSGTTACTVMYNQAGGGNYNAATEVTSSTTANKAAQTITVTTAAPSGAAYDSTFPVAATSDSGLTVAITTSGGCSISGGTVTMTSGTTACSVMYDQSGDGNYSAAAQVSTSTTATRVSQAITVTMAAPSSAAHNASFPVAATSDSGLAVTITTSGSCTGSGSGSATITMASSGNTVCTVYYNQAGDSDYAAAGEVTSITTVIKSAETIKNDFDGDSKSEMLFLNTATGATRYWVDATKLQSIYVGTYNLDYTYVGSGDFDGDGKADLLFTRTSDNATLIWSGAVKTAASYPGAGPTGFSVAAICDVNGDMKDDVIWYNTTTGITRIWSGASKTSVTYPGAQDLAYTIAACADFDGDGKADIFWHNATTGANQIWPAASKVAKTNPGTLVDVTWTPFGAGDTDGDGKADFIWYRALSEGTQVWKGGLKSAVSYPGTGTSGYTPKAIGDYDGDGKADLLWGNDTTLATQIWPAFIKANAIYPGASPTGFSVQQ